MKIYHIEMAKTGHGISGGERCLVEMARYLSHKKIENIIVTTSLGRETYESSGILKEGKYVKYLVGSISGNERRLHILFTWILCTIRGIKIVRRIAFKSEDIVICHSDLFPDFLTAHFCRRKKAGPKIYFWNHLLPPHVFYGYEGEFTKTIQIPRLNVLFFNLSTLIFRKLIIRREDAIIAISKYYERVLRSLCPNNKIYAVKYYGGIGDYNSCENKKRYDAIWIGRFHPQKGLMQLIDIVSKISQKFPQFSALVVGGGNKKIQKKFTDEIKEKNLKESIKYVGIVLDREKIKSYLREAKVFLMTSTYESFGQVSLEAMKQGVPVVAYNLPPFEPLLDGMITVPILDNNQFADKVLQLLQNRSFYKKHSKNAYTHSKKFNWDHVGKEIYDLLME